MPLSKEQVQQLVKRFARIKGDRATWNSHYEDLARVQHPSRKGFISQTTPGEKRTEDIYDGVPMQAARGLANATGSMLRPDRQNWFEIKTTEDADMRSDEAKDWLGDTAQRMRDAFEDPRAHFKQATGEVDLDLVVFGTAPMFIGEGSSLSHLLFQSLALKDTYVTWSDESEPEAVWRSRLLTIGQAMARFGLDNLSEPTRDKVKPNQTDALEERIEFIQVVKPRLEGRPGALLAVNLPVAAYWIEAPAQHLVREQGFHEFPFIAPRWDTSSGEDYGRSPGMIALPDSNTLQAMEETLLVAGQYAADPVLAMPNDGVYNPVHDVPGGFAYYDIDAAERVGSIPIKAIDRGANMPLTLEMQDAKRNQVFAAFYRNVLNLPVDGPDMTATEIIQRREEFIREVGPVFGRLETGYTAPLVERAFNIMLRANAFLPVPEALAGRRVRFEYQSPIKRMRQLIEAAAAREWLLEAIEIEKAVPGSGALDAVDLGEYMQFRAEVATLPRRLVRSPEEIAALQAERKQQQQAMAEAEMAETMANAANKAGTIPAVDRALGGEQPQRAA